MDVHRGCGFALRCKEPEEPKIPDTENVPSETAEPEKWDVLDISD